LSYRIPAPPDRLHGDASLPEDVRVEDFWRWAFSDLLEDYLKGIFAEWMVGVLLGLPMREHHRLEFLRYDLPVSSRLVEVKATAYWQSWKVLDENGSPKLFPKKPATPDGRVSFGGLKTKKGEYKADLYVFCFQRERELERWNALDLNQWEFYVLRREALERLGTRSIKLKKLRALSPQMTAREFQERMRSELGGHAAF
jgi:hypothetical protein